MPQLLQTAANVRVNMASEYIELIIRKAEMLRSMLKHCVSSDLMLSAYINIEDIVRAANAVKEELKKADEQKKP
jgi:hypothetical protein